MKINLTFTPQEKATFKSYSLRAFEVIGVCGALFAAYGSQIEHYLPHWALGAFITASCIIGWLIRFMPQANMIVDDLVSNKTPVEIATAVLKDAGIEFTQPAQNQQGHIVTITPIPGPVAVAQPEGTLL